MNNSTILVLCTWFGVLCNHVNAFNNNLMVLSINRCYFAFSVFILARDYSDKVAFFNL